ncbi:alpha/beta hydrolase [Opitutaceae bacterium TAV4]|nr:alpha/beta hydrolase [Opitutaceae bacterium TAV4]RRK00830.1 alpha/beta hydrolase [Opitutaceae bacterium TAV3]
MYHSPKSPSARFCFLRRLSQWGAASFAMVAFAVLVSAAEVTIQRDIVYYAPDGETDAAIDEFCRLDLYLPKVSPAGGFPLIVLFHGGGLHTGSRERMAALAERFASAGIAVANATYRLHPGVKFPVYVEDAARAVAWAAQHGESKGMRPGALFVGGHSAGGYLAALLATDAQYLRKAGVSDGGVAGYIPISGQLITHSQVREELGLTRLSILSNEAAPLYHLRRDMAPILFLVGDKDMPARVEETRLFVAAANDIAKNPNVSVLVVPDRNHGSIRSRLLTQDDPGGVAVMEFIRKWTP